MKVSISKSKNTTIYYLSKSVRVGNTSMYGSGSPGGYGLNDTPFLAGRSRLSRIDKTVEEIQFEDISEITEEDGQHLFTIIKAQMYGVGCRRRRND